MTDTVIFPRLSEFRDWLSIKHSSAIVGRSRRERDCPLANFLADRNKNSDPYVDCVQWKLDLYSSATKLPGWAQQFVEDLDPGGSQPISAENALRILLSMAPLGD